ncbi:MAG: glycoside hydrolase family 2 [Naasia sp.]|nr:glycoside hydrolase family 2 [Naasia sp.]
MSDDAHPRLRASEQDGRYPRPQLLRERHQPFDRGVGFAYDDGDVGLDERWFADAGRFPTEIRLPFPPESPASGIGDTGFHPVVWYRIPVPADDLAAAGYPGQGDRLILHFGAVDYEADVWVDGQHVGRHVGGQTPFSFDITAALGAHGRRGEHAVVVRAHDDPHDGTMPRGKQDWQLEPHVIWYHRTTGIWRTVWLEAVPSLSLAAIAWTPDPRAGTVALEADLSRSPGPGDTLRVEVTAGDRVLADVTMAADDRHLELVVPLHVQKNGQQHEELLWWPESPTLLDATLTLRPAGPGIADEVSSYFGLRSVGVERGRFLLNDRPRYLRSVLEQGYWPESHLTPPSVDALRAEVELILSLGFDSARIHQKVEDPRFLFWADRLGLMLWGETASAYRFAATAVERLTGEWLEIVRRDRSHPSIVTWVPFNESWGIQHVSSDPAQQAYCRALADLTRALDPSRPVVSNDGWEHVDSDLLTIHDYEASGEILTARYASAEAIEELIRGVGPAGRRLTVDPAADVGGKPVMVTEFGGISYVTREPGDAAESASWGYSTAQTPEDFERRLAELVGAIRSSPVVVGFCYTQLTDTRQETNGLCDEHRRPKLPAEVVARIVRGRPRGPAPTT